MDRVVDVMEIINRDIARKEKEILLNNILLDLKNEMEAQDENMRPEFRSRLGEAFQLANNYLLEIQSVD